jgi:hypothetical protein
MKFVTKPLKVKINGTDTVVDTEVVQFETLSEAQESAGSDERLLAVVNRYAINSSLGSVRKFLKDKATAALTTESVAERIAALRKGFSLVSAPKAGRTSAHAKQVEFYDASRAIATDAKLSDAEKAQRILALIGQARA